MLKAKCIVSDTPLGVQTRINEFLQANPHIRVGQCTTTTYGYKFLTTILYSEDKTNG